MGMTVETGLNSSCLARRVHSRVVSGSHEEVWLGTHAWHLDPIGLSSSFSKSKGSANIFSCKQKKLKAILPPNWGCIKRPCALLIKHYASKTYGGVDIHPHVFFISALVASKWPASRLSHFTPWERAPGTDWIGWWMGPRTGLDEVGGRKILPLPGLGLRPTSRPVHNELLYLLRCPDYNWGYIQRQNIYIRR
jgi:hypothetical protein